MKENKKKENKKVFLTILLLICMVSVSSGSLYGYWAGTIDDPTEVTKNKSITIGEAKGVTTTITVNDPTSEKKLVPVGKVDFSVGGSTDNVDTITETFNVKWVDSSNTATAADNITGTLEVVATPVITGATAYNNLVNVTATVPAGGTIKLNDAGSVDVPVEITLTEPTDKAAYDAIIDKTIQVTLKFNVTQ